MLVEHSLVDSLENIRLLNLSRVAFIGILPEMTRDPKLRDEIFLTPLLARHQTWFRFRRRRAFVRGRLLTSFLTRRSAF